MTEVGPGSRARVVPAEPPKIIVAAAFAIIAVALAFPSVSRLHTSVAGNSGDSLLNLWIIRSVQTGLPHGWHALWSAGIFYPAPNTLAYSDALLPVALLHWPLRLALGDALAFNVIYLGSWVLSSWCVYRLAQRVVSHWAAAFVAALAFTYSSIRLVHHGHFQLVVGGALVTLTLLVLLRLLEAPTWAHGVTLGVAFSTVALTASYYGAMTAVFAAVVVGGWFLAQQRAPSRAQITALAVAAVLVLVIVAPIGVQYLRMQRDPHFRRPFDPQAAAHVGDFLATADSSYVLRHIPVVGPRSSPSRGIENRLFPGAVALVFGSIGGVVVARKLRRRRWRDARVRELVLVAVAGGLVTILAFGDWFVVGHHRVWLPFALFRRAVPGFAGIRAESRLALGGELALALFAAVGIDRVLIPLRRVTQAIVFAVIVGALLCESAMGLQFVRVPTARDDGGIDQALRRFPHGAVLELPIRSAATGGIAWGYVETPRQLAAIRDGDPRLNGYSGFQPAGFDTEARTLNRFPDPSAIVLARALGVRYVVLRTHLVGPVTPELVTTQLNGDGIGVYRNETARRIIAAIPPRDVSRVEAEAGGYVIQLR